MRVKRYQPGKATYHWYMCIFTRDDSWLKGKSKSSNHMQTVVHRMVRPPYSNDYARNIHLRYGGYRDQYVFFNSGNIAYRPRVNS